MAIYKTVFTLEVLSEGKLPDHVSLKDLDYETTEGHCSALFVTEEIWGPLSEEVVVKECGRHGTDPDFFLGDDDA